MGERAADTLRNSRRSYEQWLAAIKQVPNTNALRAEAIQELSSTLQKAEKALQEISSAEKNSAELKEEIAAYLESVRELQKSLEHVSIRLQIRRLQMKGAKSHLQAVQGWAELTKKLR